jgi:hypothetical protein
MLLSLLIFLAGWLIHEKIRRAEAWTARDRTRLALAILAALMVKGPILYAFLLPGLVAYFFLARRGGLPNHAWAGWAPWLAPLLIFGVGRPRHLDEPRLLRTGRPARIHASALMQSTRDNREIGAGVSIGQVEIVQVAEAVMRSHRSASGTHCREPREDCFDGGWRVAKMNATTAAAPRCR